MPTQTGKPQDDDTKRLEVMMQCGWRIEISDRGIWLCIGKNNELVGESVIGPRGAIDAAMNRPDSAVERLQEFVRRGGACAVGIGSFAGWRGVERRRPNNDRRLELADRKRRRSTAALHEDTAYCTLIERDRVPE